MCKAGRRVTGVITPLLIGEKVQTLCTGGGVSPPILMILIQAQLRRRGDLEVAAIAHEPRV